MPEESTTPDLLELTRRAFAAEGARGWLSAAEGVRLVADECCELDDQRIPVPIHRSGRGKVSQVQPAPSQTKGAFLFHVRDGKATRLVAYWDRERALAGLGIEE